MPDLIERFCGTHFIGTIGVTDDCLIHNVPSIEESVILSVCSFSKIMTKHTGNKPLQSAVHSLFIHIWLCNVIVLMEEPFLCL